MATLQGKLSSSNAFSAETYVPLSSAAAAAADKWQKRVMQVGVALYHNSLALQLQVPQLSIDQVPLLQAVDSFVITASLASDTWSMISLDGKITIESKVFGDVSEHPVFRGRRVSGGAVGCRFSLACSCVFLCFFAADSNFRLRAACP